MKERDYSIDFARFIGTLLVILAHVSIPNSIREIRSFDVILLVFVSGICVNYKNYFQYLLKRFKRLVLPTWILLVALFSVTKIVCLIVKKEMIYSVSQIVRSFLFLNAGIGYIWIIRIYLGIAITLPLILYILKYIKNNMIKIMLIYCFLIVLALYGIEIKKIGFEYYIHEILVYTTIAALSYSIYNIKKEKEQNKLIYLLLLISLILVLFLSINGFTPNENKFPPRGVYIFYGIFMSTLFFKFLKKFKFNNLYWFKIVLYISKYSFGLYLIHIIVLSFINFSIKYLNFKFNWIIEYLLIIFGSILGIILIEILKKLMKKSC